MKKFLIAGMCVLMLCGCAAQEQPETTEAPTTETTVAPPETTEAPTENRQKQLAESCIDKSVEELIALIGEPQSSDYAPSCLGPGEDGNLYYEGFTVYTYREDGEETVRVVD